MKVNLFHVASLIFAFSVGLILGFDLAGEELLVTEKRLAICQSIKHPEGVREFVRSRITPVEGEVVELCGRIDL